MELRAFAKLNLSLRVFDKRPDGFHEIESVMQSVSLHDIVSLEAIPSGIEVICDDPAVPRGRKNLAYKAAELFLEPGTRQKAQGTRPKVSGIKIHIKKNIPMAAGLAGGSADAAAVLFGLNELTTDNLRLTTAELQKLAAQVGSDVPFCLTGGTCLVTGRGEIVAKQEPWPKTYFILVCPKIHVSTKWVYDEFDRLHVATPAGIKNDLEPVVVEKHEVITEIKGKLLKLGCAEAQMSGSGPSVFGTVRHEKEAEDILDKIRDDYERVHLVATTDRGVEIV